jgi:alpha-N-arabinofuranosidase
MHSRRDFLACSTALGCGLLLPLRRYAMSAEPMTVTIDTLNEIGVIQPELHSHFLEHLGTATYGGLWVGKDSSIPNINGHRKKAVEYLKELEIPVLRWPGGCFADDYHWRDGIGPPGERPRRVNLWWGMETEDNSYGTHEFIELCRLIGAEPYLAGNLGSGSPEELRNWMEYCNYPSGSTLSDERIANGATESFGVRYWGIGNESWACGGHMTPEEYCQLYFRFVTYLRAFGGTDPYFIAVGPSSNDLKWTKRFFDAFHKHRTWGVRLHAYTMHFYSWGKSKDQEYTKETMVEQLSSFVELEKAIGEQWNLVGTYPEDKRVGRIKLAVDEWGTWDRSDEEVEKTHGRLWQQNTMKDGLAAGLGLNVFHRQAEKLSMCNIAQITNVLQSPLLTYKEHCIRTPTYHVFRMYKGHKGKTALGVDHTDESDLGLSVSASRGEDELVLTLVNPKPDTDLSIRCLTTRGRVESAEAEILHHPDFNMANTFEAPEQIVPKRHAVEADGSEIRLDLPPLSVASVRASIRE